MEAVYDWAHCSTLHHLHLRSYNEKRLRFVTSKIGVGFVCAKIALKSKPEALLQLGDVKLGYSFKMRAKPDNIGRCLAVPKARRTSAVNSLPPSLCLQKLVPQID